jgi:hypothetical protein
MKILLVLCLIIAGLPVIAEIGNNAGVPQQQSTQTTAITLSTTPAAPAALAMIKKFSPKYATANYLNWGTSDEIQKAVDNAEYMVVIVPGGTRGRNIWFCPHHKKVEVAFENYAVSSKGRTAILICDQIFFTSCGNLFVTTWRPVQKPSPQPTVPTQTPVCKPPFTGGMETAVIDSWNLEAVCLEKPSVPEDLPCKADQAEIISKLCFAKSGLTPDKMPYWQSGPVMEWRLGLLWLTRCPVDGTTTTDCGHWPGPGPIPEPAVPY